MRDNPALALLDWYDRHARQMPWRVAPQDRAVGEVPDAYRVWLSEIMLQQTTVATVGPYFQTFTSRWPRVQDLAAADDADVMAAWAGLGYYARARNLLKCARAVVRDHNGQFPGTETALMRLPGIGPYTAAAIAAIAFDQQATVLDGNVERVMARRYDIHTPLPTAKPELRSRAEALTPTRRAGDYAQAVMDLGATICTPRAPACGICPWREDCRARQRGTATDLPAKLPKKPKPTRFGTVWILQRDDGAVWLITRPAKGLLGGMRAFPSTDWAEEKPSAAPPVDTTWTPVSEEVRHTFTHFHLVLSLQTARAPAGWTPPEGTFQTLEGFDPGDLPTVMRKAFVIGIRT